MKRAIPAEVQWLQGALRSAIERSQLSDSQIEHELGMRDGELGSIISGQAELGVAHLFGILRMIGLDLWKLLLLELRPELRGAEPSKALRGESLRS